MALSVAMITKNAEKRLRECLESVSFADEIVIVDSGSTDDTAEIAAEFNARWYVEPWKGYGPQKNSALDKCAHDWVLVIDADERVPKHTATQILKVLSASGTADAYSFRRKNYFHGKWIRVGDWWPDDVIRLVRKSEGRYERPVHEIWATGGRIKKLDCEIEHFSFDSYTDMFRVANDYSTSLAEYMYGAGRKASPVDAVLHACWAFGRSYFLRLGFTAGFDGLMIAYTKALGTFMKYIKLYELGKFGRG